MKAIHPDNRPKCADCNKNWAKPSGVPRNDGTRYYAQCCMGCINFKKYGARRGLRKPWQKNAATAYKKHKKTYCENVECGFIAKHPSQLDLDHIDGNHSNSDINNLQTLCANCHRLKTAINKESHSKKWRTQHAS